MYVDPFWMGVLSTIVVELAVIVIAIAWAIIKEMKK